MFSFESSENKSIKNIEELAARLEATLDFDGFIDSIAQSTYGPSVIGYKDTTHYTEIGDKENIVHQYAHRRYIEIMHDFISRGVDRITALSKGSEMQQKRAIIRLKEYIHNRSDYIKNDPYALPEISEEQRSGILERYDHALQLVDSYISQHPFTAPPNIAIKYSEDAKLINDLILKTLTTPCTIVSALLSERFGILLKQSGRDLTKRSHEAMLKHNHVEAANSVINKEILGELSHPNPQRPLSEYYLAGRSFADKFVPPPAIRYLNDVIIDMDKNDPLKFQMIEAKENLQSFLTQAVRIRTEQISSRKL